MIHVCSLLCVFDLNFKGSLKKTGPDREDPIKMSIRFYRLDCALAFTWKLSPLSHYMACIGLL